MTRTRILIISDTHCAPLKEDAAIRGIPMAFEHPLPRADLLIHCGDLTMTGQMSEYHMTLDMLRAIDAPVKLVIAGNHDLSLDQQFVLDHRSHDEQGRQPCMSEVDARRRHDEARQLWTVGRAREEGVTFLDEGMHQIQLDNGVNISVYASAYTPEFCDWGFAYARNQDRFSTTSFSDAEVIAENAIPSRNEWPIDILITHGPPWLRMDTTMSGTPAGCPLLLNALQRSRPLLHCFGHIHEGWGAERVTWSEAVCETTSIQKFKDEVWRKGTAEDGKAFSKLDIPSEQSILDMHAVYLDLTRNPIEAGKESILINAAIMDVTYKPCNAPWLIDIDLPGR